MNAAEASARRTRERELRTLAADELRERIVALEFDLSRERSRAAEREKQLAGEVARQRARAERAETASALAEKQTRETLAASATILRDAASTRRTLWRVLGGVGDSDRRVVVEVGDLPAGAEVAVRCSHDFAHRVARDDHAFVTLQAQLRHVVFALAESPHVFDALSPRLSWTAVDERPDPDAAHALAEAAAAHLGRPFDPDRALDATELLELAARLRVGRTEPQPPTRPRRSRAA